MTHVSRPLVALLLATVVFFAVWMVALKPKSDSGSSGNSAPLQSAVDKAHAAVAQSNAASTAHGGTVATTATSATPATTTPAKTSTLAAHAPTTPSAAATSLATKPRITAATAHTTATKPTNAVHATALRTAAQRQAVVIQALRAHKVIALLFYNGRAADDRAVKKELATVSTHGGQVVKLAVPLVELARYGVVTRQVPVTVSPTLILIDRDHKAWTIVGYATEFEISQRVTDALEVKPST